jgi:hypothetical protein
MADIITVSITTTAAGYIVVDGAGQVSMNGSGSDTYVMLQIDETAGGGVDAVHNRSVGFNTPPNGGDYYFTGSVTRTYFKSAGTYTFRMEGTRFGSTNASMGGITIRATFFPGSYGTVNSIVSGPDGAAFDHRTPVAASSAGSGGADAYTVDLRELELKAARAEAESQRAQRELDAAQARSVRDQMQRQVHAVSAKQPAGHP